MSLSAVVLTLAAAATTPSPSPSIPSADVTTPGPWGFTAIFGVGIVVAVLLVDMTRRIRRVRYRAEVNEKLDAEALAESDDAVDHRGGSAS